MPDLSAIFHPGTGLGRPVCSYATADKPGTLSANFFEKLCPRNIWKVAYLKFGPCFTQELSPWDTRSPKASIKCSYFVFLHDFPNFLPSHSGMNYILYQYHGIKKKGFYQNRYQYQNENHSKIM